jgi:hypothetical protein
MIQVNRHPATLHRIRSCGCFALLAALAAAYIGCASRCGAQEWLDKIDDALFLESKNGVYRVDLSGTIDLEGYYIDQRPPGLIFGNAEDFFNPRLSLFLDARAGKHLYSFVQARFDRGFDPRSEPHEARFDEYLLRYTPFDDARLNIQAGKFATLIGNWVPRHLSWDNPFINAPLPYERVTTVSDQSIVTTPGAFLPRRDLDDKKDLWLPVIWGPSYSSGASVFGSVSAFDYGIEVKNASLASRPASWDGTDIGWDDPTVSARLGYRPSAQWNLGVSFSHGSYLRPEAENAVAFPAGKRVNDFTQTMFASDVSYSWHHWQFWGEVFFNRFEVPNVDDADSVAYYLEAKYKVTAQLFAAVRWNQELFGKIDDGLGNETSWDRDTWRIDAAVGYRFTRHLQGKLQYSYNRQEGSLQQGEQLVAAQVTVKF